MRLPVCLRDYVNPALHFPFSTPPAPGSTTCVAPGIHWIRMPLPFALDHINLWCIEEDADSMILIDCGYGDDNTRALWETLFAGPLAGRTASRVLATHYHPDHLGQSSWLTERFGVALWMAQAEFLTGHAVRAGIAGYQTAGMIELFAQHGLTADHREALGKRGNSYGRGVPAIPSSYRRIVEGEIVMIGGHRWKIITGFGHSPEHLSLYCAQLGVLISGDMLLPKISTNVSVWASDPEGDPLTLFLDSLDRYVDLPADTLVLPSHGLPFRGIVPRIEQLRAHHAARLAEVSTTCRVPSTAADLIPVLFPRALDTHQTSFAMGEAIAHIHRLYRQGLLERKTDENGQTG